MTDDTLAILNKLIGDGSVRTNIKLAPYTTFKVGGPAEYYFEAYSEEDIVKAIKAAHEAKIHVHILGGVSNIVVSEEGIKGLTIRNAYSEKEILEDGNDEVLMKIGSGYNMTRLAQETAQAGYEG